MLTVKSDDVVGRVKTYEAIVKGEEIAEPASRSRSRCWSRSCAASASPSRSSTRTTRRSRSAEDDTSGDLLPDLGRINLAGFED